MELTPTLKDKSKIIPVDVQVEFIRQEHRIIKIILNFVSYYLKNDNKNDLRKKASLEALIWRIFSPGTALISGIGLVSLITLWLAWEANSLLSKQNNEILVQNHLIESERRASLSIELSAIMDRITIEAENVEDVVGYARDIEYKYDRNKKSKAENQLQLSAITEARIIAISRSFKPYRMLQPSQKNNEYILTSPRSPERGQLLVSLYSANILCPNIFQESDFSYSDLEGAFLRGILLTGNFKNALFNNADLIGSRFGLSNLEGAEFRNADLRQCKFKNANLQDVDLRGAALTQTIFTDANLSRAKLEGADLRGVEDLSVEQLMTTINWQKACLSEKLSKELGLPYSRECNKKVF
jgi:uncharacterized protein YjbI with pentapeptide repeats